MSKARRGSGMRDKLNNGRSVCPVCKRTAIKAIYEVEINGNKVSVCKQCKAGVANNKLKEAVSAL